MSMGRPRIRHVEQFRCQNPECNKDFKKIPTTAVPVPKYCCRACFQKTRFGASYTKSPAERDAHRRGAIRMWERRKGADGVSWKKEFSRRVSDILEVTGRL